MKQIKLGMMVAGVVGLISVFLPYSGSETALWDLRLRPAGTTGLLNGPDQVYVVLIGFLAATVAAGLAVAGKQLVRWQAIVGFVGFLFAFVAESVRNGLFGSEGLSTSIGGKLLFLAAAVGAIASIVGIAKPEKA